MTTYKIHPAIGVGRVGNSEQYYLGPETIGGLPTHLDESPVQSSGLRDGEGKLKRQAARFRIFRYDSPTDQGTEVTLKDTDIAAIVWTVHLANKKAVWYEFSMYRGQHGYGPNHPLRNGNVTGEARRRLITDAGPGRLAKPNQRKDFSRNAPKQPEFPNYVTSFPPQRLAPYGIDSLGSMITDSEGRLHVVGGYGNSGSEKPVPSIQNYVNNEGWFDDTSDGPVTATIIKKDGSEIAAAPAWVMVGPPSYAPQILNMITLYDTMYDAAVRELNMRPDMYKDNLWNPDYRPSFPLEIMPILRRGLAYNWVVNIPNVPHTFGSSMLANIGNPDPRYNALRQYYLDVIRNPDDPNVFMSERGTPLMPYLAGDGAFDNPKDTHKYLTLSKTQYFLFCQWAKGMFTTDRTAPAQPRGAALDQAVLSNCVGGAFSPGIEMSWNCRRGALYSEPFRLRHKGPIGKAPLILGESPDGLEAGDATKYMAVPWQADFNECASQVVEHYSDEGGHKNWVWWWPAQRPLMVFDNPDPKAAREFVSWVGQLDDHTRDDYLKFEDNLDMVTAWKDLGFIYNLGTATEPNFVEIARLAPRQKLEDKEQEKEKE